MSNTKDIKEVLRPVFIVMVIELVIGGGGHFFEIGPLTLRMVLYLFCIPVSLAYMLLKRSFDRFALFLVMAFTGLVVLGTTLSILNHGSPADIWEDLKPLIFFYTIMFFTMMIKTEEDVIKVTNLIKYSALFMGLLYLAFVLLLLNGLIDFFAFYRFMEPIGEIVFRGQFLFIYKGFLYLCIGFFFFILNRSFMGRLCALLLLTAIVLTLTRGFLLSTLSVLGIYLLFINKNKIVSFVTLCLTVVIISAALPYYVENIGDKTESDQIRYLQIEQVIDRTDVFNFFFGHGFGIGVEIRKVHMEIAYLEIFAKQGVLGLLFWLGILLYIIFMYAKLHRHERYSKMAIPFLLSVLCIYIQSATNPFINNPIGMSLVLITVVVFNRLTSFMKTEEVSGGNEVH